MKLFAKYHRINLISTIIIFLSGCFAFALLLRYVVINQVDEDLMIERNENITYINRFHHLPSVIEVNDQYTNFTATNKPLNKNYAIFTSAVYNKAEHEKELRRTIKFTVFVNNSWYLISVSKSLEDADDLIETIIIITVALILLILAATFLMNRIVLRRLWQPFYSTLHTTQQFSLSDKQKINFNSTNIDEFNYLNNTLMQALNKVQQDYQSLKEFTENASHELQTPLAVIQSKLDILIQNEKLSEAESKNIQGAYDAVQNLKKLNQSLLLLAKIENKQFSEQAEIDISELLLHKCNQFTELWKNMHICTEMNIEPLIIKSNVQLVDILLNNLLSNATKHNHVEGNIFITLQQNKIKVSNTGSAVAIDEKALFKRFSKVNVSTGGYGLGLSIIKEICDAAVYNCTYTFYKPDVHAFVVEFN